MAFFPLRRASARPGRPRRFCFANDCSGLPGFDAGHSDPTRHCFLLLPPPRGSCVGCRSCSSGRPDLISLPMSTCVCLGVAAREACVSCTTYLPFRASDGRVMALMTTSLGLSRLLTLLMSAASRRTSAEPLCKRVCRCSPLRCFLPPFDPALQLPSGQLSFMPPPPLSRSSRSIFGFCYLPLLTLPNACQKAAAPLLPQVPAGAVRLQKGRLDALTALELRGSEHAPE